MDDFIKIPATIDIETTGLTPGYNEILQLGIVTYNEKYNPLSRFVMNIRPDNKEGIVKAALDVNKIDVDNISEIHTKEEVKKQLIKWITSLSSEGPVKIVPLGHNYASFDSHFMKVWLQNDYETYFDYHVKDTYQMALVLRDLGIIKVDSCSLTSLCKYFKIAVPEHNAIGDALCALAVYKEFKKRTTALYTLYCAVKRLSLNFLSLN